MALTPVEIRHLRFSRSLAGYRRSAVDAVLEEVVDSFEDVWRDRADLADKVEHLEGELVRFRELEALLRTTLVSAERSAHELRAQAKREAELIVSEAHAEARAVTHKASAERQYLLAETRRLRTQLAAALATLEPERQDEDDEDGEDGEPPADRWQAA
jgi:cell division initiation protein